MIKKGNLTIKEQEKVTIEDIRDLLISALENKQIQQKSDDVFVIQTIKNITEKVNSFEEIMKDVHDEVKKMNELWLDVAKRLDRNELVIEEFALLHCTSEEKEMNHKLREEYKQRQEIKKENIELKKTLKKNIIFESLKYFLLMILTLVSGYCWTHIQTGKPPTNP